MTETFSLAHTLASHEPSFRGSQPWMGWFEIEDRTAKLYLEAGGWLVASVPTSEPPEELFRRQGELIAPVKVTADARLQAEMPRGRELGETFVILHSALRESLQVLAGEEQNQADEALMEPDALAEKLESCSFAWFREGNRFSIRLDPDPDSSSVAWAELNGGSLLLRAQLVRLGEPGLAPMRALGHFLLALNSRLRFARGCVRRDEVALEVVVPLAALTENVLEKAVGALKVGTRLARKECRALLNHEVAQKYLNFHLRHLRPLKPTKKRRQLK